jgi:hypothetical protein
MALWLVRAGRHGEQIVIQVKEMKEIKKINIDIRNLDHW